MSHAAPQAQAGRAAGPSDSAVRLLPTPARRRREMARARHRRATPTGAECRKPRRNGQRGEMFQQCDHAMTGITLTPDTQPALGQVSRFAYLLETVGVLD